MPKSIPYDSAKFDGGVLPKLAVRQATLCVIGRHFWQKSKYLEKQKQASFPQVCVKKHKNLVDKVL